MSTLTQKEIETAIQKVQTKAAMDLEFRKEILSDPKAAIKRVTGFDVPDGFKIKVIENEPGIDQTYVLPDFQGEELGDEDLDKVAGGDVACLSHKGGGSSS
jgi:hypothetical protein